MLCTLFFNCVMSIFNALFFFYHLLQIMEKCLTYMDQPSGMKMHHYFEHEHQTTCMTLYDNNVMYPQHTTVKLINHPSAPLINNEDE